MSYYNLVKEWYLQNDICDIIEDVPFSHFLSDVDMNKREKEQIIKGVNGGGYDTSVRSSRKILSNFEIQKKNSESRRIANQSSTIDELKRNIVEFDIGDIKKISKNTVFAEGDFNNNIMVIGEAPGEEEDIQGRPFCGDSGKLLDKMFESISIKREQLYITNTFFWRPPGNKIDLVKDEVELCRPFVEKHIYLIKPKIIICMGATAFFGLIQEKQMSITTARQNIFEYSNEYLKEKIRVVAMFHPSYLLRNAVKKKDAWQDMLYLSGLLGSINY